MSVFEEVGLSWKGEEVVVPADKVMGLIEVVEDIITIEELSAKGVKRVKVARAFAAALRYAGVRKLNDAEVYDSLFGADAMANTTGAIHALLTLMIPPEHLQAKRVEPPPGKPKATGKRAATRARSKATASSKRPT